MRHYYIRRTGIWESYELGYPAFGANDDRYLAVKKDESIKDALVRVGFDESIIQDSIIDEVRGTSEGVMTPKTKNGRTEIVGTDIALKDKDTGKTVLKLYQHID